SSHSQSPAFSAGFSCTQCCRTSTEPVPCCFSPPRLQQAGRTHPSRLAEERFCPAYAGSAQSRHRWCSYARGPCVVDQKDREASTGSNTSLCSRLRLLQRCASRPSVAGLLILSLPGGIALAWQPVVLCSIQLQM